MQATGNKYDCAIIGGGLAGLCLAIKLVQNNISVILFEKNTYPFHKVCGEYISMESWNYLVSLGLSLDTMNLPVINELGVSSADGFMLNSPLDMGGFGISRFTIDNNLYHIALQKNVTVIQNCKVQSVEYCYNRDAIIQTNQGVYEAKIVCGSYGKYAPLFIQSQPGYLKKESSKNNFIGVKYHIQTDLKPNRIELHNFTDGYCGVSKVDGNKYCLCYLTNAVNLQQNNNDIKRMEEKVLFQNPFLKKIFTQSEFVSPHPLVISNVQFHKKQSDVNEIFLLGDAAGSITPLCGNGMSMGIRASKILAEILLQFFNDRITHQQATKMYRAEWNKAFNNRIKTGYYLQHLFGKNGTTSVALKLLDKFPSLTKKIISLTHGNRF